MISDLLNLLLSGRVSFSVGDLQHLSNTNYYGFVLFANIADHGITNLSATSGGYRNAGHIIDTNYLRIVFRFTDKLSAKLDTLGLPDQ